MANGAANENGNGSDSVETLVSSIRPGMKREFSLMLKSQGGFWIEMGQRRTRSQNSCSNGKGAAKNVGDYNGNRGNKSLKGSSAKKIKKEVEHEVVCGEEGNGEEVAGVEGLKDCGAGNDGEKVGLVCEEEEPKSDVVDGNSDDEMKGNLVEGGIAEGEKMVIMELENLGSEMEIKSNMVENASEMEIDVGKVVPADYTKDAMIIEEPRDGVVDRMNEDLQIAKEISIEIESGFEFDNDVDISDLDDRAGVTVAALDVCGNSEKPLRRFTRSLLKPRVEAPEHTLPPTLAKMEMKMSKKVELKKTPTKLKELLETGLLEGLSVQYIRGVRARDKGETGLCGVIRGTGILCFCVNCKGLKVVKPINFELHAKSGNKRPPEYIYLENGKTLRDVLNACKNVPSDSLELAIRQAVGCMDAKGAKLPVDSKGSSTSVVSVMDAKGVKLPVDSKGSSASVVSVMDAKGAKLPVDSTGGSASVESVMDAEGEKLPVDSKGSSASVESVMVAKGAELPVDSKGSSASVESVQCLNCKGCMPNDFHERYPLCDTCMAIAGNEFSTNQVDDTSPRSSLMSAPSSHSRSKVKGKLTKKDLTLHKLIFQSELFPDGTELGYFAGAQNMLSGHKSGNGIYCNCCHEVVSPSTFEAHAGFASRRKPYVHIFMSNGMSLHGLSLEIKMRESSSTEENDDMCSICKGMGELLCCDACPRAFHRECINLQSFPQGKWYCRYCASMIEREKHAERNVNAVAAGRVAGVDPFEEIKKRCIRILDTIEHEDGGCVLCRGHEFTESGFGPLTVMICDQCENEYHVRCLKEYEMDDLKELPHGKWFCRRECRSIHSALQKLIADGERRLPGSVLDIIRKKHEETASEDNFDLNITWKLLHGKTASEEDRKWLSDAVSVFHDRFDPIAVNNTQDDLIPFMIDGGSNKDQDFGGIYCAILVVNSAVACAGIFRVFGQEVAEIPLVATSKDHQGKGYFQSLFYCIEDFLASLNVRKLVLPAAPEAKTIWMNKFGFEKITEHQLKEYRKDYPIMVFQGTTVLHKPVQKLVLSTELKDA